MGYLLTGRPDVPGLTLPTFILPAYAHAIADAVRRPRAAPGAFNLFTATERQHNRQFSA